MRIWLILANALGFLLLVLLFYRLDRRLSSRVILLAPVLFYVIASLEDLLGWVDFTVVFESNALLKGAILLFVLGSDIFYILFMFREIADSASRKTTLRSVVIRISLTVLVCLLFFTVVYTSIYKLFGSGNFKGSGLDGSLLEQAAAFFYFSIVTFATVGYGDIQPVDTVTRLIVAMEVFFSFITVAYMLSMLSVIRQIFKEENESGKTEGVIKPAQPDQPEQPEAKL
ncbi:ion channel [Paenibacillus pinistramenti]|uniref:ion channel n=1 Tax=Paenibacillus pinistramenti TaxID=1768003 RepID=UPI0011086245|nr:ion channel [Paenibacillus pinistramenti]